VGFSPLFDKYPAYEGFDLNGCIVCICTRIEIPKQKPFARYVIRDKNGHVFFIAD